MPSPISDTAVRDALRDVIDPELGVNIVDLGLVYGVDVDGGRITVRMTMTSPACPLGEYLKTLVDEAIRARHPDVDGVSIEIVWEPPWEPAMMSEEARQQLHDGEP